MKDFTGKELSVGDWIVYGTLLGRCAVVKIGKIISLDFIVRENWRGGDMKIGVLGCEIDYSGEHRLTKKGTLNYSDRTFIIPESAVPKEIIELYK